MAYDRETILRWFEGWKADLIAVFEVRLNSPRMSFEQEENRKVA